MKIKKPSKLYCSTEECTNEAAWSVLLTPWSKEYRYVCQAHYEAARGKFHSAYRLEIQTPILKRPEEAEIL